MGRGGLWGGGVCIEGFGDVVVFGEMVRIG